LDYHDGSTRQLKRGDVIGERAIISPKRKNTVICSTFSEFYILSVQDIITILQTEYPTTWTKRWRKMVKELKESMKIDKKRIRSVDFDKHKSDQPLPTKSDDITLQKRNSSSKSAGLYAWMATGSTIRSSLTARDKDGIKSVQINYNGEVTSPFLASRTLTKLPTITDDKEIEYDGDSGGSTVNLFKTNTNHPKSDGDMPKRNRQHTDSLHINNRGKSNGFPPTLSKSSSQPVLPRFSSLKDGKITENKKKRTGPRFGRFLVRRNSLDRDNAIQKSGLYLFCLIRSQRTLKTRLSLN